MWREIHPEKEDPSGHFEIANTLNNLGVTLMRQGKLDEAADCHRQALAMRRRLYPKDRFPLGHIQIAKSLIELGGAFELQGKKSVAFVCRQQAMEMATRLQTGKGPPKGKAGARKITFNDEDYFLALSATVPDSDATLDEYLPEGQDIDSYSRMINVTIYRQPLDLKEFAAALGADLGKIDPDFRARIVPRPGGTETLVDYVFRAKDPEALLEFNMFRLIRSGDSVTSCQFVRRIYHPTAEQERNFRGEVAAERSKWEKALNAATFPMPEARPD